LIASPRRWFDLKARALRLGDAKNDAASARLRPLGRAAVEHFAAQPDAGEYMFPSDRGDGHFVNVYGVTKRLVARAGIDKPVSPHIFRHTYGSIATELGYSELTVKGLIGHAKVGTTQLYMQMSRTADSVICQRPLRRSSTRAYVTRKVGTGTVPPMISRSLRGKSAREMLLSFMTRQPPSSAIFSFLPAIRDTARPRSDRD